MQQIARSKALQILTILTLLLYSNEALAQTISVRASVGAVHLPLSDWSNFFGSLDSSFYQKNNPNLYFTLSINYTLFETHSFSLGTELIRSSASLSSTFVVDWKFQGIPVSLCYEYRFPKLNEHFVPNAGLGISYFWSQVEAKEHFLNQTLKRTGNGYGVHGFVGLISEITQSLSMVSQIRYRYSNGMAFTGNKNDIKVEFTGIDFSTGLSWTF